GCPPIRSDEPTTRPPTTPPPARKTVWTRPQWSRPGSLYAEGSSEIFGVRPNSPALTASVESRRPQASRSASSAETARSVGGRRLSFRCGKALPCVSHVSLLPRLTCTRETPASTSLRAISSDQPKELRP